MRIVHKALVSGLLISLAACALQAGTPRSVQLTGRPLAFEENRGQTDASVRFLSRGEGYTLFLTPDEAVLALREGDSGRVLRLRWESAFSMPRITGEGELPGKSHYLMGNDPTKWRTEIVSYQKVQYKEIYPGIDLVFYGNPRQLEYDFVIAPGADPRKVRLAVKGADRMEIDPAGDLILDLGGGEVRLKRPVSYQEIGGARREVASAFRRTGDGRIGFAVGAYDPGRPLVIDPVLAYSTYLGGNDNEEGDAIAVDVAGNAYVTGWTSSPNFPTFNALKPALSLYDAFVAKMDSSGALVYSTYLGGSQIELGSGIAVDATGAVYLAGRTDSFDFPLVNSLPQQFWGNPVDAFAAKLDPSGSQLLYSTRLGGSARDEAWDLALDSQGHAYVTGHTSSDDFPAVGLLAPERGGSTDAFIAKLSPSGSALIYSSYLGGSGEDWGLAIAVDANSNAVVTGATQSVDFPTVNAVQGTLEGPGGGFVAKLHATGSSLLYSTYISGSLGGTILDVAADSSGAAYITGAADSGSGVLIAKFSPEGSPLYFFRITSDSGSSGIAIDGAGNAYVTGFTRSADFPLKDPVKTECLPSHSCFQDAFVLKLNPQGSGLVYSTYLGGTDSYPTAETGRGIAVDSQGSAYITGVTRSTDFPTANALQPAFGGGFADAFVTKISTNQPPVCSAAFASPAILWPPNGKLVPVSIRGVTDPDGDPITLRVTSVRQDEPLSRQGMPDTLGIGTSTAQLRSDRAGGGDGRVYRVTFEASDGNGGVCTVTVTVCVPHDQGRGRTCGDGGPLFSSGG